MAQLDKTCGKVVKHPWVSHSVRVLRQLLEVFARLSDQSKFKHENAVIESADEMVGINNQATLELLDCIR